MTILYNEEDIITDTPVGKSDHWMLKCEYLCYLNNDNNSSEVNNFTISLSLGDKLINVLWHNSRKTSLHLINVFVS
jgi:hypothetical protein